jgi:predicted ferric reductase
MKRRTKTLIVSSFIVSFVLFSLISILLTFNRFSFYSLGQLTGLLGFFSLSLLIISGDISRFLDRYFGIDRIIKFQRKFSIFTAVFVIIHPIFFILHDRGYSEYFFFQNVSIGMFYGVLAAYSFIIVMIASAMYKRVSYQIWQVLHILTYVLFFAGFAHARTLGSDMRGIVNTVFIILFIVFIIGLLYRNWIKLSTLKYKFLVKEIRKETETLFTLVLEPQQPFTFEPGQFAFLRLNKNRLYARHPFTIASSPDNKYLEFTIQRQGRFTKTVEHLQPGDEVKVDGPFGRFTLEDKELVFIAGGVGVTPFMSMIRSRTHEHMTLLYCTRTSNNLIFKKELESINDSWFRKEYFLSRENGRITKSDIKRHMKKDAVYYICGPESLKQAVVHMLRELGVSKKNIKIESFFW